MTTDSKPSIPLKFRSDVTVELVKHSASDSDVVWAARVSTAGERSNSEETRNKDASEHTGLVNFLMRERHGTPFEHSIFTFYVKAPIF
ncbi:MAG: FAD-dependent thymidylate synthase, partial [Actinomycetota bacterium]|nr:FAD-dependent thymidylate synthase [Actinomycetota bacterium]